MKPLTPSSSFWGLLTKVGMVLTFVVGQLPVQAGANLPMDNNTNDSGPVIVTTDRIKTPSKHRKVSHRPVKPETYPSRPQQEVRTLR